MSYLKSGEDKNYFGFPYRDYVLEKKCLFIHIPKTAGSSVGSALMDGGVYRDHLPQYVYQQANKSLFDDLFKFSFVRNPWDRAVSVYFYLKNKKPLGQVDQYYHELFNTKIDTFAKFVYFLRDHGVDNFTLFQTQSFYVVDYKGDVVVDFLGRFENIVEDVEFIGHRLKLDLNIKHKNKTLDRDYYQKYYDDETKDIVSALYKADVDNFGYKF